jgi:hypothetical protein
VTESSDFDTDCYDDDGRIVFEVAQFGYLNQNDEWVLRPKLDPVPRYTTNLEDILHLRVLLFGSSRKLRIEEVESEWGIAYSVTLVVADGKVVASCVGDVLSLAIVEVLLLALLSDWTPEYSFYQITKE